MLCFRYSTAVIILLIVALVPTIIHSYMDAKTNDGKSVKSIPATLQNYSSKPSKRNSQWGHDIFKSNNWFERDYYDMYDSKVRLFVARSYDHKRLYHHPELALSYGQSFNKKKVITLPEQPNIPINILISEDQSKLIAYTLLYDDKIIKNPITHQLRDSIRLLVSAKKPMTLFYTSQLISNSSVIERSSAVSLLVSAILNFRSQ